MHKKYYFFTIKQKEMFFPTELEPISLTREQALKEIKKWKSEGYNVNVDTMTLKEYKKYKKDEEDLILTIPAIVGLGRL